MNIHEAPIPHHDTLREIGLFGGLSDEAIDAFSAGLHAVRVDPGVAILREGENVHEMFVVLEGELEVVRSVQGASTEGRIALLGAGNWVGEMSILDPQPRSATVRTLSSVLLLRIGADDLDRLYRSDMRAYLIIVLNMARELARRLRVADSVIASFVVSTLESNLGFSRPRR